MLLTLYVLWLTCFGKKCEWSEHCQKAQGIWPSESCISTWISVNRPWLGQTFQAGGWCQWYCCWWCIGTGWWGRDWSLSFYSKKHYKHAPLKWFYCEKNCHSRTITVKFPNGNVWRTIASDAVNIQNNSCIQKSTLLSRGTTFRLWTKQSVWVYLYTWAVVLFLCNLAILLWLLYCSVKLVYFVNHHSRATF